MNLLKHQINKKYSFRPSIFYLKKSFENGVQWTISKTTQILHNGDLNNDRKKDEAKGDIVKHPVTSAHFSDTYLSEGTFQEILDQVVIHRFWYPWKTYTITLIWNNKSDLKWVIWWGWQLLMMRMTSRAQVIVATTELYYEMRCWAKIGLTEHNSESSPSEILDVFV